MAFSRAFLVVAALLATGAGLPGWLHDDAATPSRADAGCGTSGDDHSQPQAPHDSSKCLVCFLVHSVRGGASPDEPTTVPGLGSCAVRAYAIWTSIESSHFYGPAAPRGPPV